MTLSFNFNKQRLIRLSQSLSLIFFACAVLSSCYQEKHGEEITIIWDNNQAKGLVVPKSLLNIKSVDSIKHLMQVRLHGAGPVDMLGDYGFEEDKIIFTPAIPLTRGLTYEIIFRNAPIGKIVIPLADPARAPAVTAIFPTQDTLPENLLKFYIQFSAAMREGESQRHIAMLDHNNDTIPGVFLDLQPELWNKERTVLTLWLDPGRTKRELIPNQLLGAPLQNGKYYTLVISNNWKDVQGLPLSQNYSKRFFTTSRDSLSPDPGQWVMRLPLRGTHQPLKVDCKEPLDYFLLQETISILDENQNMIKGKVVVSTDEKKIVFIPELSWSPGTYLIRVGSYLEDLAGNNLNRLFDRDIRKGNDQEHKEIFLRSFDIQ